MDYNSWYKSSIGIYRKENDEYVLVFKKSFSDNLGRWVKIEFGEDTMKIDPNLSINYQGEGLAISGDIGYLGCFGGCRLLWWDFYEWDSTQKTYVLANNKNLDYFKNLLVDYEDFNKTYCLKNANVPKSISSLYLLRKDKEKICSDDAIEPAATIKQAETLLKGIKAIKSIIGGENIPMSEVSKISLDQDKVIKKEAVGTPVVYYGYSNKISTSGEARFLYYDIKTNDFVKPETQYSWYWAMPVNVPDDSALTNNWVKFINENVDSVFKITGTRGKDDCGYWGPDHCVENIDIKMIEVVGKNLKMEF